MLNNLLFFAQSQAEFVPLARVPPHPWQMATAPHRSRNHHHHLKKLEETGEVFVRPKRKGSQHHFGRIPSDLIEDSVTDVAPEVFTASTVNEDQDVTEAPQWRAKTTERGLHRFRKTNAPEMSDREKLMNKFWSSVYSPLPYGGPRALNRDDETEAGYGAHQASSLPVARTAHREKEKERTELRVPTPDSEIPSPGHYRQPINHTILHSSKSVSSRRRQQNNVTQSSTVNVEAFRILMEVIKSLREVSALTLPSPTPQPDVEGASSISTDTPSEIDDARK